MAAKEHSSSRREFLHQAAGVTAGVGLASLGGCRPHFSTDASKPNIILITADDLGWKDLSCYGNENIKTPHLDRLSEEGATFRQAFVVSSSCAPSRASFITGQYPHTHGVTGLTHIYKSRSLSPFHRTLPDLLSQAGYNTALQGKWHVSPYLPTSWYGYRERLSGIFPQDFYIHHTQKTLDFIERNKKNRFYLEINYMQNHRDAYGEFKEAPGFPVSPEKIKVPSYMALPNWPEIRRDLARFYSQTLHMDSMIGEILQALDHWRLAHNTVVLFVSDNGPPYPGNKMTLYDRGVGVPLLVRWPARIHARRNIVHLVNSIDMMPTLLQCAGLSIPSSVQGRSFLPLMQDPNARPTHEALFLEMTHHVYYLPSRAVRTHRWKYIRNYSDIAPGLDQNNHMEWAHRLCQLPQQPWKKTRPPHELYDLKKDPHEQNNLASHNAYKTTLASLQYRLYHHMKATQDPFLGKKFTHDYRPEAYKKSKAGEKYK